MATARSGALKARVCASQGLRRVRWTGPAAWVSHARQLLQAKPATHLSVCLADRAGRTAPVMSWFMPSQWYAVRKDRQAGAALLPGALCHRDRICPARCSQQAPCLGGIVTGVATVAAKRVGALGPAPIRLSLPKAAMPQSMSHNSLARWHLRGTLKVS